MATDSYLLTRRQALRVALGSAAPLAFGPILAACGGVQAPPRAPAAGAAASVSPSPSPAGQTLTTQLYMPNEPRNNSDGIFNQKTVMTVADGPNASKQATFNFVLNSA